MYIMTQIFSYEVFRGVLGFANWWMQFLSFATIGCGLAYQSYFDQAWWDLPLYYVATHRSSTYVSIRRAQWTKNPSPGSHRVSFPYRNGCSTSSHENTNLSFCVCVCVFNVCHVIHPGTDLWWSSPMMLLFLIYQEWWSLIYRNWNNNKKLVWFKPDFLSVLIKLLPRAVVYNVIFVLFWSRVLNIPSCFCRIDHGWFLRCAA